MYIENGWIKFPLDGSTYLGQDSDVAKGLASWRNTPTLLESALILHNGWVVKIHGVGEYWQSDVYETKFLEGKSKLVKRRIERQIDHDNQAFIFKQSREKQHEFFFSMNPGEFDGQYVYQTLSQKGQWFIAELNLVKNKCNWIISDSKL